MKKKTCIDTTRFINYHKLLKTKWEKIIHNTVVKEF